MEMARSTISAEFGNLARTRHVGTDRCEVLLGNSLGSIDADTNPVDHIVFAEHRSIESLDSLGLECADKVFGLVAIGGFFKLDGIGGGIGWDG
jgi:hypothetical protein